MEINLFKTFLAFLNMRPLGETSVNVLNEVGSRESKEGQFQQFHSFCTAAGKFLICLLCQL